MAVSTIVLASITFQSVHLLLLRKTCDFNMIISRIHYRYLHDNTSKHSEQGNLVCSLDLQFHQGLQREEEDQCVGDDVHHTDRRVGEHRVPARPVDGRVPLETDRRAEENRDEHGLKHPGDRTYHDDVGGDLEAWDTENALHVPRHGQLDQPDDQGVEELRGKCQLGKEGVLGRRHCCKVVSCAADYNHCSEIQTFD